MTNPCPTDESLSHGTRGRRLLTLTRSVWIGSALVGWITGSQLQAQGTADASKAVLQVKRLDRKTTVDFEREILPMLKANCLACHNKTTTKGDLNLETPALIVKGGESGPAVVPGKAAESLLFKVATHEAKPRMPPRDNKVSAVDLSPEQLGLLQLWIEQGAKGEVRGDVALTWQSLPDSLKGIYAVALTADGRFASCARANRISIYDLALHEEDARLRGDANPEPKPIHTPTAPVPSGKSRTKAAKAPEPVSVPEAHPPAPMPAGAAHLDWVSALAFSPDGSRLASGAYRDVKIWRREIPEVEKERVKVAAADSLHTISADGRWIASATTKGSIQITDLHAGTAARKLASVRSTVRHLRFSSDTSNLVATSADGTVRVYDVKAGKERTTWKTPTPATALAVAGDRRVILGFEDGSVRDWMLGETNAVSTGSNLLSLTNSIRALAVSVAGDRLAAGDSSGWVMVREGVQSQNAKRYRHGEPVTALGFAADLRSLVSGAQDGSIKVWDLAKTEPVFQGRGDRESLDLISMRDRSAVLATNTVTFLKAQLAATTNELNGQLDRDKKATEALATAEKEATQKTEALAKAVMLRTEATNAVSTFEADAKRINETIEAVPKQIGSLIDVSKLTAETKALADKVRSQLAEKKKVLEQKVTDTTKASESAQAELKKAEMSLANARNEKELADKAVEKARSSVAAAEELVKAAVLAATSAGESLVAARTSEEQRRAPILSVGFGSDARRVMAVDTNGVVQQWTVGWAKAVECFRVAPHATRSAQVLAPNRIALVDNQGTARRWRLNEGWKLERTIGNGSTNSPFADRVTALRFSPDGQLLATGGGQPSRGGELKLWNVATGVLHKDLTNIHSDVVFALDFSEDSKLLASCSADRFAKVTEIESGSIRKTFEGHTDYVLGVRFRADGRGLVTGGADNIVKVWDVLTGERKRNVDGAAKEVTAVSFLGLLDHTLSASGDGQLRVNDEKGAKVRSFDVGGDYLQSLETTPRGDVVIAGGGQGVLRAWDGQGKIITTFR